MDRMFSYCEKFNQDISEWNVSNVTNMSWMFFCCEIEEKYKPKFK
jgi:surface protein